MKRITTILLMVLMGSVIQANSFDNAKKAERSPGTAEEEFIQECIESEFGHENLVIDLDCPEAIVMDRQMNPVASGKADDIYMISLIRQSNFLTRVHATSYYRLENVTPVYENGITALSK